MIKNTIFWDNYATNNGGGICVIDGTNTLLVNSLFNDNHIANGNGNAIYIVGNNSVKIINNTISGNTGNATSSSVYCLYATTVEIYNSIIYPDTLGATTVPPFPNVRVEHCCLPAIPAPPIQNPNPTSLIIGNPNFVNMAPLPAGNYRLQAASSCIDAGSTNHIFPFSATDLEGNPRFVNRSTGTFPIIEVDMGAFEF